MPCYCGDCEYKKKAEDLEMILQQWYDLDAIHLKNKEWLLREENRKGQATT